VSFFSCNDSVAALALVLSDKKVIGGDSEYCGDNDPQLDRTNVFYHGASGGKRRDQR
jgi:hypothetical protein